MVSAAPDTAELYRRLMRRLETTFAGKIDDASADAIAYAAAELYHRQIEPQLWEEKSAHELLDLFGVPRAGVFAPYSLSERLVAFCRRASQSEYVRRAHEVLTTLGVPRTDEAGNDQPLRWRVAQLVASGALDAAENDGEAQEADVFSEAKDEAATEEAKAPSAGTGRKARPRKATATRQPGAAGTRSRRKPAADPSVDTAGLDAPADDTTPDLDVARDGDAGETGEADGADEADDEQVGAAGAGGAPAVDTAEVTKTAETDKPADADVPGAPAEADTTGDDKPAEDKPGEAEPGEAGEAREAEAGEAGEAEAGEAGEAEAGEAGEAEAGEAGEAPAEAGEAPAEAGEAPTEAGAETVEVELDVDREPAAAPLADAVRALEHAARVEAELSQTTPEAAGGVDLVALAATLNNVQSELMSLRAAVDALSVELRERLEVIHEEVLTARGVLRPPTGEALAPAAMQETVEVPPLLAPEPEPDPSERRRWRRRVLLVVLLTLIAFAVAAIIVGLVTVGWDKVRSETLHMITTVARGVLV